MTPNEKLENSVRLACAADAGDAAEVARLIPISDPTSMSNSALCFAAQGGHVTCVELLIPVSSTIVFDEYSSPILKAAENGHTQCVSLLIPMTEKSWIHHALCAAVQRNDIECVKLLMNECDPKERNSLPLQLAAEHNNEECIALLYNLSDPAQALETLQSRTSNRDHWSVLKQRLDDERLRGVLCNEVGEGELVRKHKM